MTFQVMIRTGPRDNDEFANSYATLWIARAKQPSELVIEWGPYNLSAGSTAEDQKFGKVWLLPYHTNKDSSQAHPVGYTWYDELIISRNRIADPSAATSSPTPADTMRPTAPASLNATAASASRINLSWTASTDNVGVTGYRVNRDGTHVGTSAATSYADSGLSAGTTHSYNVSAVDAAGNVSLESTTASATTTAASTPPPSPTPTSGTSLASLAGSMQAGTWAELTNTTAFNSGAVLQPPAGGSLLEYTNRGSWNPINKTAMVLGGAHTEPKLQLQRDAVCEVHGLQQQLDEHAAQSVPERRQCLRRRYRSRL